MSLPIPDAPSPAAQSELELGASFEPSLPVIALCGYTLPVLRYALKYKLKIPAIPPPIPIPFISLGLLCSLNNPLDVTAGVPNGGGRKSKVPKDPDDDFA